MSSWSSRQWYRDGNRWGVSKYGWRHERYGRSTKQDKIDVYNLMNEVVYEVNFGELGPDTIESLLEQLRKQHVKNNC